MSDDTRREINARSGDEVSLLIHMHGPDPEMAVWAAEGLIKLYAEQGRHGALLRLCDSGRLTIGLAEEAELAIVDSIPLRSESVPGREPKKYGILEDLALDRKRPEKVRVAAGMKRVDILMEKLKGGDSSAKKAIEDVAKHRRHHKNVKLYARHSLDAFEAAKDKPAKGFGKKPKHQPQFQQGQPRIKNGAFVP